jgi:hypothetical protein
MPNSELIWTVRSAFWATLWAAGDAARSGRAAPCGQADRGARSPVRWTGLGGQIRGLWRVWRAPGSPALWGHASRSEGCRYGRIRGLPGRGDGKIDREPVILGMHRRQLGQSRPMARGAAIAATPTYRITTALAPSSSAPRRRASRRGYTTSRAGRGGCSSRRRRVRAVSRHRAPRRRIPWLGG